MRALPTILVLVLGLGCAPYNDIELIDLSRVEPDVVEEETTVVLHGTGFPIGRFGMLTLEGTQSAPGKPTHRLHVEIPVRAVDPDRVTLSATREVLLRLGGRGTFHGELQLAFSVQDHRSQVVGVLRNVQLDLRPEGRANVRAEDAQRRESRQLAREFGLVLGELSNEGIMIAGVEPGSPADEKGLRVSDQLIELDGLRLASPDEFLPSTEDAPLVVVRQGRSSPFRVNLSRAASPKSARSSVPWPLLSVAGVLLLFVLFLSPGASIASWFVRSLANRSDPGHVHESVVGFLLDERRGRGPARRRLTRTVLALLAGSLAFAALSWTSTTLPFGMHAGALLLLALTAQVIPSAPRQPRMAPLRLVGHLLPLGAAVTSIALLHGDWGVPGLVQRQGCWPWEWTLFSNPVGFAAFVLLATASVDWWAGLEESKLSSPARIAVRVHLFMISGLAAALFLGGWLVPKQVAPPGLGHALFAAKAWGVAWLCVRLRSCLRVTHPSSPWLRAGFVFASLGLVAGTLSWLWLKVPPELPEVLTTILAVSALLLAGIALRSRLDRRDARGLDVERLV